MNTLERCLTVSALIFADKFWDELVHDPSSLLPPLMEVHSPATLIQTHLHKARGMEGQTKSKGR